MIMNVLSYVLLFAALGAAGVGGFFLLRQHLDGTGGRGSLFGPKPDRRLDVVEQWSLDARRKLVLIRRDNVEHLIMTGGPVDVIIETGINEAVRANPSVDAPQRSSRGPSVVAVSPLPTNLTGPRSSA